MTVKFNIVERGNPGNPEAPKKFYPSVTSSGRLTMRELAKEISRISTVSSVDTLAVLEALLTLIPEEMQRGNVVELGDFGNFWLKNNAEGADTAEAVTAAHISNLLPRFNPGKEFKKVLDAIEFEKA